jgi:GNAT superfamily N-acetyltransferase
MLKVRPVQPSDAETICSHRRKMFEEAGRTKDELETMTGAFRLWLEPRLRDGRYFGFFAEEDDATLAGIGLMVIDWPPHPLHPSTSQRGYVLNVFVDSAVRGRGIATELMQRAETEFRTRSIEYLILHATVQGRPLYEKLGWLATAEMAKKL